MLANVALSGRVCGQAGGCVGTVLGRSTCQVRVVLLEIQASDQQGEVKTSLCAHLKHLLHKLIEPGAALPPNSSLRAESLWV